MKISGRLALLGLRWTLGLVVVWQSYRLLRHTLPQVQGGTHTPLTWIHMVLGSAEIIAAIVFLVPLTMVTGGYALLVIFLLAAVISLLHGSSDVSGLVLYGMVVLACLTNAKSGGTR
jgi:hypothetical protein